MATRYSTATAFLEHASTADDFHYEVPSSAPLPKSAPPSLLAQADHALSSSTFFPPYARTDGFVLARIVEDAYQLELRWVAFSRRGQHQAVEQAMDEDPSASPFADLDAHPGTLPPVRFIFPARLVPNPSFAILESTSQLQVYCLTEEGYLYVLSFPLESLFYQPTLANEPWSEEFRIESLAGRTPVLMQGVDEGRIVVGCADGFTVGLEIVRRADGAVIETELRSPSSFSIRSLVPAFSARNLNSPTKLSPYSSQSSAPSQLLSVVASPPHTHDDDTTSTFAFGVSRDRKLKIWHLESGNCLRAIDLPKPSSSSSSAVIPSSNAFPASPDRQQHLPKAGMLLPPSPQSLVKIVSMTSPSSPYGSYLALFVPASSSSPAAFYLYGLAIKSATGELSELVPLTDRVCDAQVGTLVDFEVKRMSLAGEEQWTLWTAWEDGGETEVRCAALPELAGTGEGPGEAWTTVRRGTSAQTAEWTAAYFDDQLRDSNVSVPETFLRHISYPGRYPPATIDYALQMYEELVLSEIDADDLPEPFALEYDSLLDHAAAVVGCLIKLEHSPQTGAPLHDEYAKRLKLEWLRFVAMLNESRAAALFPTCLSVDEQRGVVCVVGRDSVAVPIVEEAVQTLHNLRSPDAEQALDLPAPQTDLLPVLTLVRALTSRLSTAGLAFLEVALLDRLRIPFETDIEDISLDLFERTLEPVLSEEALSQIVDGLRSLSHPAQAVEAFCELLRATEAPAAMAVQAKSTDLTNALLTDALSTSISARFDLAKGLVALLLAAWGADEEGDPAFPQLEQTTSVAFATLHSIAALHWVATQIVEPSLEAVASAQHGEKDSDGGMFERFGELRMQGGGAGGAADVVPVPTYGLLNALLRIPPYSPSVPSSAYSALPVALASAASAFLTSTGLLGRKHLIDVSPSDVTFAFALVQLGLPAPARELVAFYPRAAGMAYVEGRAELELGNGEEAVGAFERAAAELYAADVLPADDASASGLSLVLPSQIGTSLARYYIHIVSLFVPYSIDHAIARFARLALEQLDEEGIEDEVAAKDLWIKLFRSLAATGEFEQAYEVVMEAPYHETKTTCLAHFISLVCENGATSLLTTLPFVGLEADLERNLAFRARNSDPLARPDYYKVLYAYHIAKGDYRSAGTVMYQQARRIGEITARGGSFRDLATLQCQSYLAAANALSLVAKEHAWVAVMGGDDLERGNKRRKITYHIPDDEYDSSASRPLEVLELADIRKEYNVALARLQLAAEFPELERTNFYLEPQAVVALFSQTGAFDQAFTAGRILEVDLSSLFEIIAERCVNLTVHPEGTEDASWVALSDEASTWEGSLASKAWRLLERHLERHDAAPTYSYRLVVLERALALNCGGKLPTFLTDFLLRHAPHALIQTLIKYDRLGEAFRYSLATLQTSPAPSAPFSTHVPYSLFDQLLAIPASDSPALSSDVLKERQTQLREAVETRFVALEKAQGAAKRDGGARP
ncbi:hypothetical protein JCM21900_000955 [Sporobolomyces salmonicolor]